MKQTRNDICDFFSPGSIPGILSRYGGRSKLVWTPHALRFVLDWSRVCIQA